LVDRSGSAYKRVRHSRDSHSLNPTNAVGGSFRLCLQRRPALPRQSLSKIPPTQLVDRSGSTYKGVRHSRDQSLSKIPPTQLVDRSGSTYKGVRHSRDSSLSNNPPLRW